MMYRYSLIAGLAFFAVVMASDSAVIQKNFLEKNYGAFKNPHLPNSYFASIAWSPDARYIVLANNDRSLQTYRFFTTGPGGVRLEPYGNVDASGFGCTVAWRPDGQFVASASGNGFIKIYQFFSGASGLGLVATGEITNFGNAAIYDLSWSPCGHYLAAAGIGSNTGKIAVYRFTTTDNCLTLVCVAEVGKFVEHVSWSPSGRMLLAGYYDKDANDDGFSSIKVYRFAKQWRRLEVVGDGVRLPFLAFSSMAWSPDSMSVAVGGVRDAQVKVYYLPDICTGFSEAGEGIIEEPGWYNSSVSWSADGKNVLVANYRINAAGRANCVIKKYDFSLYIDSNHGGGLREGGICEYVPDIVPLSVSWACHGRYAALMYVVKDQDGVVTPLIKVASTTGYKKGEGGIEYGHNNPGGFAAGYSNDSFLV